MFSKNEIINTLNKVRANSPLVHNITNYVVMNTTANALLAVGASPVMAHAENEVEDMVGIASSLVINMGTLSEKWVNAMLLAGKRAIERGIPVVFDPVGVGATPYRTEVAKQLIEVCKPTVIRGNASEIIGLTNSDIVTKGVDSTESSNNAVASAKLLAKSTQSIIVISGDIDYITDGDKVLTIKNGSPLIAKVTGMGCTATAIIGAFVGVESNVLLASVSAMAVMAVSGEIASEKSNGNGSMQVNFLDTLCNLGANEILKKLL